MSTRTIVAAVALSSATGLALAQASSPSREEVNADTQAAMKKRELTPAGGGHPAHAPKPASKTASSPSRAAVRAEAASATHKYELGAAPPPRPPANQAKSSSTLTREQRRAQTKADVEAGKMTPAGPGVPK